MTEKDLDIAIEKCEQIMEFDTRTLNNPESEDGWIFDKVYDLLQFLRQFQFVEQMPSAQPSVSKTEIIGDTISRQAAINVVRKAKDKSEAHRMLIQLPSAQSGWIPCTPETMPQEDGEYLVTIHWESGGYYTDLLAYKAYWKEWKDEDRICGAVTAWQPKPIPWEGGQDEQN